MTRFQPVLFVVKLEMQNKLLLIFFCFPLMNCLFGGAIEERIKQLSLSDRAVMKIFFDEVIEKDQAGHVLFFSNKPVCLTGPVLKDTHKTFKDVLCLRGWNAFKKNEHLLPHPNFIFSERIVKFGDNFKVLHIYVVNKQTLKKCLGEHIDLFRQTLGIKFTPELFITQLEEGRFLTSLLNNDEMLLGILLGYGKESSHAFKKTRPLCTKTFAPLPTESYCRIDLTRPKGCKISPVVFMGNPNSSEVRQLTSAYEDELEAIWIKYKQSGSPLKMVLERLCVENQTTQDIGGTCSRGSLKPESRID